MNNGLMRLSELVPTYTRFYKVSNREAAYALYELIERLYVEHGVNRFRPNSINDIFWVGSLGGFERSTRSYILYFQSLSKYFFDLFNSPPEDQKDILSCYCENSQQSVNIPAKLVCFSKASLFEWVVEAGLAFPEFVLSGNLISTVGKSKSDGGFNEQELATISKVMNGFVDMVKEVEKAYRESPTDYHGKKRAENIKRYAYMFSNPPRANFDIYSALISLAEEAGIDMPADHQTLRKYMRAQPKVQ